MSPKLGTFTSVVTELAIDEVEGDDNGQPSTVSCGVVAACSATKGDLVEFPTQPKVKTGADGTSCIDRSFPEIRPEATKVAPKRFPELCERGIGTRVVDEFSLSGGDVLPPQTGGTLLPPKREQGSVRDVVIEDDELGGADTSSVAGGDAVGSLTITLRPLEFVAGRVDEALRTTGELLKNGCDGARRLVVLLPNKRGLAVPMLGLAAPKLNDIAV